MTKIKGKKEFDLLLKSNGWFPRETLIDTCDFSYRKKNEEFAILSDVSDKNFYLLHGTKGKILYDYKRGNTTQEKFEKIINAFKKKCGGLND